MAAVNGAFSQIALPADPKAGNELRRAIVFSAFRTKAVFGGPFFADLGQALEAVLAAIAVKFEERHRYLKGYHEQSALWHTGKWDPVAQMDRAGAF